MIMAALRSLLFFIESLIDDSFSSIRGARIGVFIVGRLVSFRKPNPARQKLIISAGYALIVVATCATLHPSMRV